jgi:predicted RNA methylase
MAIAQVYTWNPRPGALEQFMGVAKRADKIIRGLGASTRTLTSVAGATPNAILYVMETPNWKAHAELSTKLETDKDWQKLIAEMNSMDKPTADLVSSAVYSEIPLG